MDGQTDGPGGQADVPNISNSTEMDRVSHSEGAEMYLSAGGSKCNIKEMDGTRSHAEVLTGHRDILNVDTYAIKPENEMQIVSIPRKREKPPDIPIGPARAAPDEPDGCRNHMDVLSTCSDMHSIGNNTEMAENETPNVRKCQNKLKKQNSHEMLKIEMSEPTDQWKQVSTGDRGGYILWNVPVRVQGRTFEFGEVESTVGWIMADIRHNKWQRHSLDVSDSSAAGCRKSAFASKPKNTRWRLASVVLATHPTRRASIWSR